MNYCNPVPECGAVVEWIVKDHHDYKSRNTLPIRDSLRKEADVTDCPTDKELAQRRRWPN